jgi:hypothetical protein
VAVKVTLNMTGCPQCQLAGAFAVNQDEAPADGGSDIIEVMLAGVDGHRGEERRSLCMPKLDDLGGTGFILPIHSLPYMLDQCPLTPLT